MHKYRIKYLSDNDSANWKTYETEKPVKIGDTIRLACGFYHLITAIHDQKTGVQLVVSKSAETPQEALLVAKQLGHHK